MIKLGTSGFSYDDWIGPVYPQQLPRYAWLEYYAERFETVELNVTYYRVPGEKVIAGWADRTPEEFVYSVKAHRSLTHERDEPGFKSFADALSPLIQAGKLACVLAQFPHSFHPDPDNRAYLRQMRDGLAELPVVIEFRDSAWISEETFADLKSMSFGFCCVDEPQLKGLMPSVAVTTGPVAYVRLHGRNAEKWWRHEHAWERYDYTYQVPELEAWVPRIKELDREAPLTLVYANNHYRGQSVDTIRKLETLLVG
jgi:uncharacterized protein YecE (DUF72 family)